MSEFIQVLNHGFVRLDDSMADDLSVVNAARVSFAQRSELEIADWDPESDKTSYRLAEKDAGLIRFLMRNRHGTPFEHNSFRFHVKAPLFVFREWQRHRWSSFNEWSARYSELKPEFHVPELTEVRTQVGKPGNYSYEPAPQDSAEEFVLDLERESFRSFEYYQKAIRNGIAKEQAREFLPVNIYSEMYWTVNARGLMNFLSLRNDPQAQQEIRRYAAQIERLFSEKMPVTAEAFEENGRIAP